MSIYKDAYMTSIGSMYPTRQLEVSIKEALIKDQGLQNENLGLVDNGEYRAVFITGKFSSEVDIPLFTHPITINNFQGKNFLVTDMRLFLGKWSWDAKIEDLVKNRTDFNFAKSRAMLNLIWLNEGPQVLKNNLSFSAGVFSSVISETISRAFALDFNDLITIGVLAEIYYYSLFLDSETLSDDDKQKIVVHIIRSGKIRAEYVYGILDKIDSVKDLNEFCANVPKVVENVRLEKFNSALLLSIMANSWYGTNAKEIISVSLEHPPTWIALVFTALSEKTFKSSIVFKTAERLGKRGAADQFMMSYTSLVKSHTVAIEKFAIRDFE
jgi:hypothetical protein